MRDSNILLQDTARRTPDLIGVKPYFMYGIGIFHSTNARVLRVIAFIQAKPCFVYKKTLPEWRDNCERNKQ